MTRISVLLATEGTFPFHKGGVSTWCDVLTRNLPEIDFTLLAIMMHPYLQQRYQLAGNVRQLLKVPLWGIEDPAEYSWHFPFSAALKVKTGTTEQLIAAEFLPIFEPFLRTLFWHNSTPPRELKRRELLGQLLLAMYRYFQKHDYHQTMRSRAVWRAFQQITDEELTAETLANSASKPTLAETTEALRLLYRFLLVLHFPVPPSDISHSAAAAFCGLPCVIAKLERGTPYLLTEHGIYLREQYLNLNRHIPSYFVRRFLYQLISAIVAINYHYADQISPVCAYNTRWEEWWLAAKEKIRVIYNGVDPARFQPVDNPPNVRPQVANVGLIFPLKGMIDLIESAAIVRQQTPNVEFRLYGSASDQQYFADCQRRVQQHSLAQTVIFAGSTDKPWQVYSSADVVAMASISEGFPYVVIEAMLCGAAIVATDVGGVREALGDTGLLVRPYRPAELAAAINELLQAPQRRQELGRRARARALEFFTQEKFLQQYRESYGELLNLEVSSSQSMEKERAGSPRSQPLASIEHFSDLKK